MRIGASTLTEMVSHWRVFSRGAIRDTPHFKKNSTLISWLRLVCEEGGRREGSGEKSLEAVHHGHQAITAEGRRPGPRGAWCGRGGTVGCWMLFALVAIVCPLTPGKRLPRNAAEGLEGRGGAATFSVLGD